MLVGKEQRRRSHLERLHDLARDGVQQFDGISGAQQPLAEFVETLHLVAPAVGFGGLVARARGEIAGQDRSRQERHERDPVLRVRNRKCPHGRQEKIIVGQRRGQRHEHGNPKSPQSGNTEDGKQIGERHGGRIEPVRLLVEISNGQNRGQRGRISGEGGGQIFGHRPNLA